MRYICRMFKVAPSVLSADFGNLQRDIEMINKSEADWFHVDVMDGVFVPNISFGFPVMKALQQHATKPLDVHLMIVQPERYFEAFKEAGAEVLSFHYEASTHLHRSIFAIKDLGMKAGVALNPHTPVSVLEDTIADIDLVVLMSVNPGFGGQKFIPNTYRKITQLKEMIQRNNSQALIEIDGGVSTSNAAELVKTGADVLVAGNAVFASPDPISTIHSLKQGV
ncbi:MAG: ribulose-phosphate 3-epimerase [Bacteroidota bacterium]|nr:ribulose-phosphate 3-epimerase [Bacteroidota bacterium]MDX5431599.1 ribulose-phosphate 3-epimerase [Bacteroidota bacterium]MDX5470320.1 ribulose-phosphate 3-epimerase [Bacteroidota bacterium]